MVKNPKYAFIWLEDVVNAVIDDTCRLHSVPYSKGLITFYMKKNFAYHGILNYQIKLMQESGQLEKLWNKWKPRASANCLANNQSGAAIGFIPILSAFGILLLSMGLSIVIFVIEKVTN